MRESFIPHRQFQDREQGERRPLMMLREGNDYRATEDANWCGCPMNIPRMSDHEVITNATGFTW